MVLGYNGKTNDNKISKLKEKKTLIIMYRFGPKNTFGIRKDWCLVVVKG